LAAFLAFTHFSSYRAGKANVRAEFDAYRIQHEQLAREAERAAREKEQQLQKDFDDAAQAAREENDELQKDVDRLADDADGLRADIDNFKRRAPKSTNPANGGKSKPDSSPSDMLAELYLGSVRTNQELSVFADRLRVAGIACERSVDALSVP
jgi:TATA-binding protein-associated factor Taf7